MRLKADSTSPRFRPIMRATKRGVTPLNESTLLLTAFTMRSLVVGALFNRLGKAAKFEPSCVLAVRVVP
jgi:hypothetical protein